MNSTLTACEILSNLTDAGVTITLDEGHLRVVAPWPSDDVPEQVRKLLRELKEHQTEATMHLTAATNSQPLCAGHPSSPAAPLQERTPEKPGSFIPGGLLPDGMEGSGGEDRTAGASVADNSEAQRHLKVARAQALAIGTPDECNALGATCREQIRVQGYCLVESGVLGEIIAVADSDHLRNLAPTGSITYTLAELTLLAEGYKAGHIVTIGDLRTLHAAKQKLGGVIVK